MRVLFFASLRDVMGAGEQQLDPSPGMTVGGLLDLLEAQQPFLRPARGKYRVAVDLQMADEEFVLDGATEVALIPPVSGGSGPWVRLTHEPIVPQEVSDAVRHPECGATVLFLGTTRDLFEGKPVTRLDYTAYETMALQGMSRLASEVESRVAPGRVALWHRLGPVAVAEVSVALAVSSPHRGAAFREAAWLMDELKREVPVWKQEVGPDGSVWVEGNQRVKVSETT